MRPDATTARRPAPLPIALTPLLGRDAEARQLRARLDAPLTRLVTITGPGGVGKTRLALDVATELAAEREIAFVPLAAITEPDLVLPAILHAYGEYGDGPDAPEDRLADLLGSQPTLLILDNLEQVLGAAPALAAILARCPAVTMLVTSQAPLNIAGEQLYPLAPLATPPADERGLSGITASDAVALFVDRARAVKPGFALDEGNAATVADICRRLDGLPLAIELAAARTRLLSPESLLARLSNRLRVLGGERRDAPDRLRTMRNAIAWSYDLLAPDEQRLFRRLSVFPGGAPLEAVEAIHQPEGSGWAAIDVLSALVDHSLVQAVPLPSGETRYVLLETLRDFGQEQLDVTGEADVARLAHASWYIALGEAAEPHLIGRDQAAWLERLEPETENIRAAARWLLDREREDLTLRLVGSLARFCSSHGLAADARTWLRRALAAPSTQDAPERAQALIGAGDLFEELRELDTARDYYDEARAVAAATGNTFAESRAMIGLGIVAHDSGDYAAALPLHECGLALAREAGDLHTIARSLGNLGAVSYFQGQLDDAERYWEESRAALAELGDTMTEALATSNLGALAYERGDLERSGQRHRRALALQRQIHATRDLPYTLINLAGVATLQGDYELAHACVGEAIALVRESGNTALEGIALNVAAGLALAEGRIVDTASHLIDSTRLFTEVGDQRAVIENAEILAEACAARGMHTAAAELLAAAARVRRDLGSEITPFKDKELARTEAAIRECLDAGAIAAAQAAGNRLEVDALPRRIATIAREIVGTRRAPVLAMPARSVVEPVPQPVDYALTARELEVLRLLTEGQSTDEISEMLFISPRTTSTHLTHVLGKLGVTSRTAAVALALREGVV
jgi:predicted ATPase/DNA-binding CsgD family transcriptional regulator